MKLFFKKSIEILLIIIILYQESHVFRGKQKKATLWKSIQLTKFINQLNHLHLLQIKKGLIQNSHSFPKSKFLRRLQRGCQTFVHVGQKFTSPRRNLLFRTMLLWIAYELRFFNLFNQFYVQIHERFKANCLCNVADKFKVKRHWTSFHWLVGTFSDFNWEAKSHQSWENYSLKNRLRVGWRISVCFVHQCL